MKILRGLTPRIFRYPPTPYFVEGVAPRDSGGYGFYGKTETIGRFYRVFYFLSLTWQMNPKNSGLFKGLTAINAK
ncbi:hypothetical protein [Coleofasciculus chthonoplastes]|uniref:hypothetical protein n=1 Tax=Coleofasciculus chthonoplastes TaxID=64178 RepID=UPI0032F6FA4B